MWLKTRIPDLCLPSEQNPLNQDSMLDIVKCLSYFEEVMPEHAIIMPPKSEQVQVEGQTKGKHRFQRSPTSVMSPIMGAPAAEEDRTGGQSGDVSNNNSNNPGCNPELHCSVASPANVVSRHSSSSVTGLDLEAIETDAQS